tara:strand:+ start:335 stop:1279 length:945 start_codon:yes stop_codon:yes gene_type:complete
MKLKIILFTFLFSFLSSETLFPGMFGDDLKNEIIDTYKPTSTLGYNTARDTMYLRVDRIGGEVKGIYTNFSMTLPNGVDPSTHLYNNGSNNGINCEHLWPQSLGSGQEPQKSDMHHMRPCKTNVNTSRGNKPFGESVDNQTDTWFWLGYQYSNIPNSQIDEYSESNSYNFEPREDRKGDVARSIFYFYTMYSNVANQNFFTGQKDELFNWHLQDNPSNDEINRTWAIAFYQQNKPNPFIIDTSLIERIYFWDNILSGDINVDHHLDVLDLVQMITIIVNQESYSNEVLYIIDANQDNDFNVLDIVNFVQIIVGE